MLDFGASERWPPKYCARKWEEMHPGRLPFQSSSNVLLQDPWGTGQCSPVESLNPSPRPPQQWIWRTWTPTRLFLCLKNSRTSFLPLASFSTYALAWTRSGIVASSDKMEHLISSIPAGFCDAWHYYCFGAPWFRQPGPLFVLYFLPRWKKNSRTHTHKLFHLYRPLKNGTKLSWVSFVIYMFLLWLSDWGQKVLLRSPLVLLFY